MIELPYIQSELSFPDVSQALPDGLLAYGGDLSVARLLLAYKNGIFPWYAEGEPILWWSPDPRLVLFTDEFILRKSLKKRMKHFEIRYNTAFEAVIRHCGTIEREGQKGTWITEELIQGYIGLHKAGHAHSIEAWQGEKLVGGLYGVSIGKVFFGESMFTTVRDASKVAFADLVERLRTQDVKLIDCQVSSNHLISLGAREISRDKFINILNEDVTKEHLIL